MKLTEFNNGIEPENNPSKIHLFVNRDNLGFGTYLQTIVEYLFLLFFMKKTYPCNRGL